MRLIRRTLSVIAMLLLAAAPAMADKYDDTVKLFKDAGQSSSFFAKSYAYAVFPTIGKAWRRAWYSAVNNRTLVGRCVLIPPLDQHPHRALPTVVSLG